MKVADDKLRSVLGITDVAFKRGVVTGIARSARARSSLGVRGFGSLQ